MMLNHDDMALMAGKGISPAQLESQLARFSSGFPFLKLYSSATIGAGIKALADDEKRQAEDRWSRYLADGGEVCKFVPASGAASRMFKALFAFADGPEDSPKPGSDVDKLLARLPEAAFAAELNAALVRLHGKDAAALMADGRYKDVVKGIISPEGLNYGALPKALLTFHRYADGSTRTPLEEQLMEGAQTAAAGGRVKLHFTVSANHQALFDAKLSEAVPQFEKLTGLRYDISTSQQKPSTDTVAADAQGLPFRDKDGRIVFRPGGHGALIENLNDIDSMVVFIKNIDNVVPDTHRQATIEWKKVLAGTLLLAHDRATECLQALLAGNTDQALLESAAALLQREFCIISPKFQQLKGADLAQFMISLLDRPMRVCGMVRNEGEPGGGPFIAYNPDGTASPQILESTQIDMANPQSAAMLAKATHFNPVDLVCCLRRFDGSKYSLPDFVDPDTGFISSKSLDGRELRALELPGLWNGAMSNWLTIFVEVPAPTFNPVKTVNDLLRPAHQA